MLRVLPDAYSWRGRGVLSKDAAASLRSRAEALALHLRRAYGPAALVETWTDERCADCARTHVRVRHPQARPKIVLIAGVMVQVERGARLVAV